MASPAAHPPRQQFPPARSCCRPSRQRSPRQRRIRPGQMEQQPAAAESEHPAAQAVNASTPIPADAAARALAKCSRMPRGRVGALGQEPRNHTSKPTIVRRVVSPCPPLFESGSDTSSEVERCRNRRAFPSARARRRRRPRPPRSHRDAPELPMPIAEAPRLKRAARDSRTRCARAGRIGVEREREQRSRSRSTISGTYSRACQPGCAQRRLPGRLNCSQSVTRAMT